MHILTSSVCNLCRTSHKCYGHTCTVLLQLMRLVASRQAQVIVSSWRAGSASAASTGTTSQDRQLSAAALKDNTRWAAYQASLAKNGYFKGNIPGSVQYKALLAEAAQSFMHTQGQQQSVGPNQSPAETIAAILEQPIQPENFQVLCCPCWFAYYLSTTRLLPFDASVTVCTSLDLGCTQSRQLCTEPVCDVGTVVVLVSKGSATWCILIRLLNASLQSFITHRTVLRMMTHG